MNYLQFVASIIQSIAWPLAFSFGLYHFRQEIRPLFTKITTFKGFGLDLAFDQKIKEVRQIEIQEARLETQLKLPNIPDNTRGQISNELADLSARRQQLQDELAALTINMFGGGLTPGKTRNLRLLIDHFGVARVLAATAGDLVREFPSILKQIEAENSVLNPDPVARQRRIVGGGLTGLRSEGLLDDNNLLTLRGAEILKNIATQDALREPGVVS